MRDLQSPKSILLKAVLFFVISALGSILILAENFSWKTAFLLVLVIWASARLYYFMFYVIEKYVDPSYKFSGVGSFLKYMIRRTSQEHKK